MTSTLTSSILNMDFRYYTLYKTVPPYPPMNKMVKAIRVYLAEDSHQEWSQIKGDYTWYQVLARGIETMENFSDTEWTKILMDNIDTKDGSA